MGDSKIKWKKILWSDEIKMERKGVNSYAVSYFTLYIFYWLLIWKLNYIDHDSIYKSNKRGKHPRGCIPFIGTVSFIWLHAPNRDVHTMMLTAVIVKQPDGRWYSCYLLCTMSNFLTELRKLPPVTTNIHPCVGLKGSPPHVCNLARFSLRHFNQRWSTTYAVEAKQIKHI